MTEEQLQLDLELGAAPSGPKPQPRETAGTTAGTARQGPEHRAATERPPKTQAFHYTNAVRAVVTDIVETMEEFRHVDLKRVLVAFAQARQQSKHGTYATCFPLRFEGGAREMLHQGRRYQMPVVRTLEEEEALYILYFMLPRFHDETDYHEKLATIIHELFHISPLFNGDIRRFPGKNFAHGHSRELYHAAMRKLADKYLATSPRAHSHEFLRVPWAELAARPGGIVGMQIARPRPVPVINSRPGVER